MLNLTDFNDLLVVAMQVNLILTVAPYTPDKRGDRSVVRDGVREDVTGSSILLPDLNVHDLTRDGPSSLIALFAQVIASEHCAVDMCS